MIIPFTTPSPIAEIREREDWMAVHSSALLADLLRVLSGVWYYADTAERAALLDHLADEVAADTERRRFRDLRATLDAYDTREDFISLVSASDTLGIEVPDLVQAHLALYVDLGRGWRNAFFSTDAFYQHYRVFNVPDMP